MLATNIVILTPGQRQSLIARLTSSFPCRKAPEFVAGAKKVVIVL